MSLRALVLLACLRAATAHPAEATQPATAVAAAPLVTPTPTATLAIYGDGELRRRDIPFTSELASYVGGLFSELGSAIPSYVTDGLFPGLQNLPTGSKVLSSVGAKSTDLDAIPTSVLNIPSYGNMTQNGWNLRLRGNVYKTPSIANKTLNDLANGFLIDTSVEKLPQSQADQARNLTREIYVVQQGDVNVTMNMVDLAGGYQTLNLPYPTTEQGDFDAFVPIQNTSGGLLAGFGDISPQAVNLYTQGTDTGNATSYLVSDHGLTVISDIDDILRITKIYEPKQGLLNSFAKPFVPWMNMPDIYSNWSTSLPNMHFHYLTTTPEQITRNYMQFIYATYPGGSFDTRPLNFSDVAATLSIRKYLLDKIFETYPNRKFILVADTSNSDVMRDYPQMATDYPGQVQCIFLRNTSATDPGDKFPYNTKGFKDLNTDTYMFFKVPDDLTGLDIVNGQCRNMTIPQNVTFGYQGLPFGINLGNGGSGSSPSGSSGSGGSSGAASQVSIPWFIMALTSVAILMAGF